MTIHNPATNNFALTLLLYNQLEKRLTFSLHQTPSPFRLSKQSPLYRSSSYSCPFSPASLDPSHLELLHHSSCLKDLRRLLSPQDVSGVLSTCFAKLSTTRACLMQRWGTLVAIQRVHHTEVYARARLAVSLSSPLSHYYNNN
jgi:hypothetical protein